MEEIKECLTCGTTLVEIGNKQVNGRYTKDKLICPDCWGQCPECADWYRTGDSCPKHEDSELIH